MIELVKDMAMFELSIEVIFIISMFVILMILSFIPDDAWIKFYKSDSIDEFLHPKH